MPGWENHARQIKWSSHPICLIFPEFHVPINGLRYSNGEQHKVRVDEVPVLDNLSGML